MSFYDSLWDKWVTRFWWMRGLLAAVTLAALVPKFTDLSELQVLRAFHALMISWNLVAAKIGVVLSSIPLLPKISGTVVSALVFSLSVGLPSLSLQYAGWLAAIKDSGKDGALRRIGVFVSATSRLILPAVTLFSIYILAISYDSANGKTW